MSRRVDPRLVLAHALGLLSVGIAVSLGLWQLDAWQARRDAEAVDLTSATPVPLAEAMGPDDPFPGDLVGQPVELRGTWRADGTVLVSGRERQGEVGYWVVTPLGIDDGSALPVVRGWAASPDDVPPAPQGSAEVLAWLQPPDGDGSVDDDPTDDVFPQLRVADLAQRVDGDLYSAYAVAQEGIDGLPAADLEELPEASTFTALRNLLYAVEWWVFAAFAGLVWWRYVRDSREERTASDPVASGP